MKKRIVSALIILSCGVAVCGGYRNTVGKTEGKTAVISVDADYPQYNSASELVKQADAVVSGKVTNIQYKMLDVSTQSGKDSETGLDSSTAMPYTLYTISVDKVYKKDKTLGDSTITVKCLGGKIDNTVYKLENAKPIKKDKKYMFLLKTYNNSYPSMLNVTQASYDMNSADAQYDTNGITLSQILNQFN